MRNSFIPGLRFVLFVAAVLCVYATSFSQDKYSRFKLQLSRDRIPDIVNLGVMVDGNVVFEGDSAVLEISEREIALLKKNGYDGRILISDMSNYYEQRAKNEKKGVNTVPAPGLEKAAADTSYTGYVKPAGYSYGSMGGFHTLDEIYAALDTLTKKYPAFVSARKQIGTLKSVENRPVYYVKLASNVSVEDSTKPQAMFNALHHAREPAGMESQLFFMMYLLENYASNDSIRFLVDNTRMYFVPCVNVDGYAYNQTTNPSGGGMWRKNRKNNGDGTYGVDLNRNYGYHWSQAVTNTSADDYNGPSAFSEQETRVMREFDTTHHFETSISIHCYGDYLIYPWGYTATGCPDSGYFHSTATMLTKQNAYKIGDALQTVGYTAVGGSMDWCYGDTTLKNRIIEFSPEAGSSTDGFWPVQSRIVPNCQMNMYMLLMTARLSHGAFLSDLSPATVTGKSCELRFSLKRVSLDPRIFRVRIKPLDKWIISVADTAVLSGLDTFQARQDSLSYTLDPSIATGQVFSFGLEFTDGKYVISRTIKKTYTGTTGIAGREFTGNYGAAAVSVLHRRLRIFVGNGSRVTLVNCKGSVVLARNFVKATTAGGTEYDLAGLSGGVYIVRIAGICRTIIIE
jgi:hypothetical protein